jgi:hypothetical protein
MDIGHSKYIHNKIVYLVIDNTNVLAMYEYILGLRSS